MTLPQFYEDRRNNSAAMADDVRVRELTMQWFLATLPYKYSYNFEWLGRPIVQYPPDVLALQQIIWDVKPDLIVETGVAHGGSAVFFASQLELLKNDGIVVAVDIEIRPDNRAALENHPLAHRLRLVEGSSIDASTIAEVKALAKNRKRAVVVLDSNHTHAHVLEELRSYSPLVKAGSYVVVLDTIIEDFPAGTFPDRPWDKGDNPKTAVHAFLADNDRFIIDKERENPLLMTVAPDGYLKCIRD